MTNEVDTHDPAGMARWLRERSTAAREFLSLDSEAQQRQYLNKWQQNVLPHLAFRFEQAAQLIERLERERAEAVASFNTMVAKAAELSAHEPECKHEDHEARLLIDESCAKWCTTCGAFAESMDDTWRLPKSRQAKPTQLHCDCDKCTAARLHHYAQNRSSP